jgi:flagellar hook-basal body complex protein FliE
MAVNPISGVNPIRGAQQARGVQANLPVEKDEKVGFNDVLKNAIDSVDGKQKLSAQAVQDFITGKTQDSLPMVQAVAKADLSFKLLMGVRNKVIEAYKETMRMQV